jgi:hypothetical protein
MFTVLLFVWTFTVITLPTERPPLVDLVPTLADRGVSRGQRSGSTLPLITVVRCRLRAEFAAD